MHKQRKILALGPGPGLRYYAWTKVWSGAWPSGPQGRRFWFPEGRDLDGSFEIFEILGGAGDINNSISMLNYCNGPYIRLLPCANKVLSAWTEVWSGTWPSSQRFCFPEVAIWADFSEIFEILGGAGDINISISTPNY